MTEIKPPPKPTLNELLILIKDLEEGLVELDPKDLGIVFDGLRDKIDGYVELSQYMVDRAAAIKMRGRKMLEQAKYLENANERLKRHLAFLLDENDSPEVYGNLWRVALSKHKKVVTTTEPDEELQAKYPELMKQKVEYSWDKTAIKDVLKNTSLDFAKIEETTSIRVRVNK